MAQKLEMRGVHVQMFVLTWDRAKEEQWGVGWLQGSGTQECDCHLGMCRMDCEINGRRFLAFRFSRFY